METEEMEELIMRRLEDLAETYSLHLQNGNEEEAEIIRKKGEELAAAADAGWSFLYMPDLGFGKVR